MTKLPPKFDIDGIRKLRWIPKIKRSNGEYDMWELVSDETGETIVSLGVPHGRNDIAGYVAACCSNPVRWVTNMWRPDPLKDGVSDPDGILEAEGKAIGDVLFEAYATWLEKNGTDVSPKQANGWTLNDAMANVWFAFCGQLSHDMRGRLLFKFLQLATADYAPPPGGLSAEQFKPEKP